MYNIFCEEVCSRLAAVGIVPKQTADFILRDFEFWEITLLEFANLDKNDKKTNFIDRNTG